MEGPREVGKRVTGVCDSLVRRDQKTDRHSSGGRGTGVKPAHQWGSPGAGLGRGGCGVHVTEESINLPQRNTPTSVTHLGETGPHPCSSPVFLTPSVFPKPISWQEGSLHTTALGLSKSRVTYFDGKVLLAQGHHDLDRRKSDAGLMAFHSRPHGILQWERW